MCDMFGHKLLHKVNNSKETLELLDVCGVTCH